MGLEKATPVKLIPEHYKWLGNNFKLSKEVGLAAEDLQAALPRLELYEVPKHTTIVKEQEQGSDLFVVFLGQLSVNKTRQHWAPAEAARLGPGDYFGEIALLGGGPRTATVMSETDCRVFKLPADQVKALLAKNAKLAEHLKKVADERLKKLAELAK